MTEYMMVDKLKLKNVIESAKEMCQENYDNTGDRYPDYEKALDDIIESAKPVSAEPYGYECIWCPGEEAETLLLRPSSDQGEKVDYDAAVKCGFPLKPLYAAPQPEQQWIKCSDRLPTESDADYKGCCWVLEDDREPYIWKINQLVAFCKNNLGGYNPLWAPTGLRKPQPPEGE